MSFFPFSSSSSSAPSLGLSDDPHLEIIVTPSASAFYAGETFSASIVFRNTRTPSFARPSSSVSRLSADTITPKLTPRQFPLSPVASTAEKPLPSRRGNIGEGIPVRVLETENAEAGPSRAPRDPSSSYPRGGDDPRAVRDPLSSSPTRSKFTNLRSPEGFNERYAGLGKGHAGAGRRTKSLALGEKGMSPQEMVWALGGGQGESLRVVRTIVD